MDDKFGAFLFGILPEREIWFLEIDMEESRTMDFHPRFQLSSQLQSPSFEFLHGKKST